MSDYFVQGRFPGRAARPSRADPLTSTLRAPSHFADQLSLSPLGPGAIAGGGPAQKESEFIQGSGLEISGSDVGGQTQISLWDAKPCSIWHEPTVSFRILEVEEFGSIIIIIIVTYGGDNRSCHFRELQQ